MAVTIKASVSPYFLANCPDEYAVGDVVRVSGDEVGGRFQVARVDVGDGAKMPAVGVIVRKVGTTCIAQVAGVMKDIYAGLTPGLPVFVGVGARLTQAFPTGGGKYLQEMGFALSSSSVQLEKGLFVAT